MREIKIKLIGDLIDGLFFLFILSIPIIAILIQYYKWGNQKMTEKYRHYRKGMEVYKFVVKHSKIT